MSSRAREETEHYRRVLRIGLNGFPQRLEFGAGAHDLVAQIAGFYEQVATVVTGRAAAVKLILMA
jgi:hypothetical protein